jgi:hypothetical protein
MNAGAPASSKTQCDRILRLLTDARGAWVPSPEIAALALQYNSRVFELRRLGFCIENRVEEADGVRHSWYRLVQSVPKSPNQDWYERERGRRPKPEHDASDLPLFSRGDRS